MPPVSSDEIHRAAALVRELPIFWSAEAGGDATSDVCARGYFLGAEECARVLAARTGLEVRRGEGCGGSWPLLIGDGQIMAPALPVALARETVEGPDGIYRYQRGRVWREASGAEELFLAVDPVGATVGDSFDLLWYGDAERVRIGDGNLEIEDLFGLVRVPANRSNFDRVRSKYPPIDCGALSRLLKAPGDGPQIVEVRRAAALSIGDRWRDPGRFLTARADVEGVCHRGDTVYVIRADGRRVVFNIVDDETGWSLSRCGGDYPVAEFRLDRLSTLVRLRATLDPQVDVLVPGMRGRVVFDLRADLVAVG